MYESPIQLFFDEIFDEIQHEIDGTVYSAVQNVGVNVDKEELIKALQYDRGQYEKGYADAMQKTRWIPVSERLPEENETVIASTKCGVYPETHYTKKYGWEWAYEAGSDYWVELKDVVAWQPLPEPYKGEE